MDSADGHYGAGGVAAGGAAVPHARQLNHAREQLAAVVQELTTIGQHIVEGDHADLADDGRRGGKGTSELYELRRALKHLEVDCEGAKQRAKRLEADKQELLDTQERLEAELRSVQRQLTEAKRVIRHQEIDLHRLKGTPIPDGMDNEDIVHEDPLPTEDTVSTMKGEALSTDKDALLSPSLNTLAQNGLGHQAHSRSTSQLSKSQLTSALKKKEVELGAELKRREKLEQRVTKDRDRLERLVTLAEKQRLENEGLRKVASQAQAFAKECESKMRKCFERSHSLHTALYLAGGGQNGAQNGANGAQWAGAPGGNGSPVGSPASKMTRQASSPVILPSVKPGRGNGSP